MTASDGAGELGRLVDHLPPIMAEHDFTRDFVSILDEVLGDVVTRVDGAGAYFDPGIAPPAFVRMLARWMALPPVAVPEHDEHAARSYVAFAAPLFRLRGTRRGLQYELAAATGEDVSVTDPGGVFLGDDVPPESEDDVVVIRFAGSTGRLSRDEVDSLVREHLPIGVRHTILDNGPGQGPVASP